MPLISPAAAPHRVHPASMNLSFGQQPSDGQLSGEPAAVVPRDHPHAHPADDAPINLRVSLRTCTAASENFAAAFDWLKFSSGLSPAARSQLERIQHCLQVCVHSLGMMVRMEAAGQGPTHSVVASFGPRHAATLTTLILTAGTGLEAVAVEACRDGKGAVLQLGQLARSLLKVIDVGQAIMKLGDAEYARSPLADSALAKITALAADPPIGLLQERVAQVGKV